MSFTARMATFMCSVIEAERTDQPHLCDAQSVVSRSCGKDHPRGHGRQALRRRARCVLAHERNGSFIVHSKVSPVRRLTTRLYFKRVARGREAKLQQKAGVKLKTLLTNQFLTGANLAHETREVREAEPIFLRTPSEPIIPWLDWKLRAARAGVKKVTPS